MSDTTKDTVETPTLPGDGLRESIVDDLRRHIGEGLVEFLLKPQDDLWIRVSADTWEATGRALHAMGFEYFCFLSAIDWKPSPFGRGEDDPTQPPPERSTAIKQGYAGGTSRFQVFARVTDPRRHVGVTLKVDVDDVQDGAPLAIDSWHAVYAGANWHEREAHEMYGISFNGHPDLRNMYLPTDFEGYPQRKDFPLLARMVKPWPGIVDVEPMPVDEAAAGEAGDTPADGAGSAGVTDGAGAPEAAGGTVAEAAREAGGVAVADGSADSAGSVAEEAPEGDAAAVPDGSAASVSANVTDSGVSADTNSEPAAPATAEDVETAAVDAADEARVADDAIETDVAHGEAAAAEAVPIEPGTANAESPVDTSSTEDAGPDSEAADHPESATEPADATEGTVADAPDHADREATDASESVTASAPDRSAADTETGVGSASEQPDAKPKAEP